MASMRPRVFPAEDPVAGPVVGADCLASMRPRVFPAEDSRRSMSLCMCVPRLQ